MKNDNYFENNDQICLISYFLLHYSGKLDVYARKSSILLLYFYKQQCTAKAKNIAGEREHDVLLFQVNGKIGRN